MLLKIILKKMCAFVNLLFLKPNIMYFDQGLNNLNIQKMIYHHFLFNLLNIEKKIACVWRYCCENG
jgi:hypothetical protein